MKIRIATRQSRLALWQARWVAAAIREHASDVTVEEVHVVTQGDRITDRPLQAIGGKALFVSEVEARLCSGEADIAVHSLKDVPGDTPLAEGMAIVCTPAREDPRDVLLSAGGEELEGLPAGARVGTTSLRRVCQLRQRRPDLEFATLRGNVDTRLRKLDEGQYHAIVLAAAGLGRLGLLADRPHRMIPTEICLPAVGQGTLAIEGRADDERLRALLAPLEDARARLEATAERAMLEALDGNCRVPIAGFARLDEAAGLLSLQGMVGSVDGERVLSAGADEYLTDREPEARRQAAHRLGVEVAESLRARGAADIMREAMAAAARDAHGGNGGGDRTPFKWSR